MKNISDFFTVCKSCTTPNRHPGCHDTCKYYLEEREKYEVAKKQEKLEKKQRTYVSSKRINCKTAMSIFTIDELIKEYENEK